MCMMIHIYLPLGLVVKCVDVIFAGCGRFPIQRDCQRSDKRCPHRVLCSVVRPLQESRTEVRRTRREGQYYILVLENH